jgi:thiosulfate/3-mercaptopyruvate sulfurtransferase
MATNAHPQAPPSLTSPLVAVDELRRRLTRGDAAPVIVDCRFRLDAPEAGEAAWRTARIPGAAYAHLDRDLSDPVVPGRTGRHPLPAPATTRARLAALGVAHDAPVVFVDDAGGAFAARAWWLACAAGHRDAHVLDGGLGAWTAAGGELDPAPPAAADPAAPWPEAPPLLAAVDADEVLADLGARVLVDARAAPRFEGEEEPIDPIAGHIPGARCAPFTDNLGADGHFRDAGALAERWRALLGPDPAAAVCYCGSGVTAAHNVLAAVAAGLPAPRLYGGSWSEWITDPERPVVTGPERGP